MPETSIGRQQERIAALEAQHARLLQHASEIESAVPGLLASLQMSRQMADDEINHTADCREKVETARLGIEATEQVLHYVRSQVSALRNGAVRCAEVIGVEREILAVLFVPQSDAEAA